MTVPRTLAMWFCICGALGVAGASKRALGEPKKEFTLELRVDGRQPGAQAGQPLARNDVIPAGTEISLRASADESIYLYLVDMEPGQWSETLFPPGGDATLAAREVLLLPQNGAQYTAAPGSKVVTLGIFASRAPIDKAACRMLRLHCQPQRNGTLLLRGEQQDGRKPPADPPPGRLRRERDGGELRIDNNATMRVTSRGGRLLFLFNLRVGPCEQTHRLSKPPPLTFTPCGSDEKPR